MEKLTDEQVNAAFDILNDNKAADYDKYRFHCWKPMDYKGCKMYLRHLKFRGGIIFEYLVLFGGEIYSQSQLVTTKGRVKKSEIEICYANTYAMAVATIDTLITIQCEKEKTKKI